MRIAKAPGTAQKSCTAFSRCSDAFQQLKCHSRRQRRQREKITLHGLHYPAACRCHLLHKPQFPTENRFRNVGPNSLSPIASLPYLVAQIAPQAFPRRFTSGVRTDSPMSKYCSHGNLLRFSLLCISDRIIATTTKICTRCTIHASLRCTLRLVPYALLRSDGF